jgi:hypothetical protein
MQGTGGHLDTSTEHLKTVYTKDTEYKQLIK